MSSRLISSFVLFALCAGLSGCATAVRGSSEAVEISSLPQGASAISDLPSKRPLTFKDGSVHNFYGCAPTPCRINLPRRSAPVVLVSKQGYAPIKFKIVSTWETGAASVPPGAVVAGTPGGSHVIAGTPDALRRIPVQGASLIGGVMSVGAGSAIDFISGSNFSLSPNPVTVKLAPLGVSAPGSTP